MKRSNQRRVVGLAAGALLCGAALLPSARAGEPVSFSPPAAAAPASSPAPAAGPAAAPQPFVSEEGHYKVLFPGTPTHSAEALPGKAGQSVIVASDAWGNDSTGYTVLYLDLTEEAIASMGAERYLAQVEADLVVPLGLPDDGVAMTLKGLPARHFHARSGAYELDEYLVLAGHRLYQLTLAQRAGADDKNAGKFLKSFEVL